MKFLSYLRVELKRIFHSKIVYLVMILTIFSPMAGYKLYNDGMLDETITGHFIGNPTVAGALIGGILFAMLTFLKFDQGRKYKTEILLSSIVSPLALNAVRLIVIEVSAIITVSIEAVFYYPYTVMKMGRVFDGYTYWNSFFLLILPSVMLSILAASALYQIFQRVDLSAAVFIVLVLPNLFQRVPIGNIMRWIKPAVPELSDYFSNTEVFRLMEHNRLFWFLMFGGVWLISVLGVRIYGKGLFTSIFYNSKRIIYIPLIAVVMISEAGYAFVNEPDVYILSKNQIADLLEIFKDKSEDNRYKVNKELQLLNSDFKISFDGSKGSLSANAVYSFNNLSDSEQECKLKLNPGYSIRVVKINDKVVPLKKLDTLEANAEFIIPVGKDINVTMEYEGKPKIFYMVSDDILDTTISDKYIDLSSKEIIPEMQVTDSKDNSNITAELTMPSGLMPIINPCQMDENGKGIANITGDTTKLISEEGNKKTWFVKFKGTRFDLMAGDYVMKQLGSKEMPVQFYYSSKHGDNMKKMNAEKIMKYTIDYCTKHYGKLKKVSENNPLKIVEKTALFPGGLGFPNYSTMTENCFSDENLSNTSKGSSGAEVLAHELAHQWFGVETVGWHGNNENWSAEGLAVYTTYRIAKENYGEEYAQKNYVNKWKDDVKYSEKNFYYRHPEYLNLLSERYVEKVKGENRSVCLYSKLPLQILKASELVGGEDKMDEILAKLYENSSKEKISWQDFLDACNLKEEDLNLD
ncbi:M1 family aminopeptidase [Clostridium beijerinckii]|nr:M1 family aminopeptidase [Clostridium beijerinckii]